MPASGKMSTCLLDEAFIVMPGVVWFVALQATSSALIKARKVGRSPVIHFLLCRIRVFSLLQGSQNRSACGRTLLLCKWVSQLSFDNTFIFCLINYNIFYC